MTDIRSETESLTMVIERASAWLLSRIDVMADSGDTGTNEIAPLILALECAGALRGLDEARRRRLHSLLEAEFRDLGQADLVPTAPSDADLSAEWSTQHSPVELALHAADALRTQDPLDDDSLVARLARAATNGCDGAGGADTNSDPFLMLTSLVVRAEVLGDDTATASYHRILDRLEKEQDALTGAWGRLDEDRPDTLVVAASRAVAFFDYVHRPLHYVDRLTDFLLHDGIGAIRAEAGSARRDLAGAYLLARVSRTGYRIATVREAMLDGLARMSVLQSRNGSFDEVDVASAGGIAGDAGGGVRNTWLRLAALRTIGSSLSSEDRSAIFRRWPGPASRPANGMLTEMEREVLPTWWRALDPRRLARSRETPRVSVVIPCYNLGEYIRDAITSVLDQSIGFVEIIVVDDGSTEDVTRAILHELAANGVTVLHQANSGVAAARNAGIGVARAPYVCCLDPDDRLRSTFLEAAASVLDATPEVAVVSGQMQFFDGLDSVMCRETAELPDLLAENTVVQPAVFRRDAWENVGGYRGDFRMSGIEDWDFWLSILQRGHAILVLPDIVWEYRIQPAQMSTTMYRPENWGPLFRELMERHAAVVRPDFPAVLEGLARRWAVEHEWAVDGMRGARWWQVEAAFLRGELARFATQFSQSRVWIEDLERGRDWERTQRENWRGNADKLQELADERGKWITELEQARDWAIGQAANWRREAEEWRRKAEESAAALAEYESSLQDGETRHMDP